MEAEVCSDRIHMLPEIPPEYSASSFWGCLKGKSGYERWENAKFRYGNREFWRKGYLLIRPERIPKRQPGILQEDGKAGRQIMDFVPFMASQTICVWLKSDTSFGCG